MEFLFFDNLLVITVSNLIVTLTTITSNNGNLHLEREYYEFNLMDRFPSVSFKDNECNRVL